LPIGCSHQVISDDGSNENYEDITSNKGDGADTDIRHHAGSPVQGEALISILNWGL